MAVDVSSVARMLRGYAKEREAERELVTMDLLGGGGGGGDGGGSGGDGGGSGAAVRGGGAAGFGGEEVDLDVKVPSGWERRLDLMSGKTYLAPPHVHVHVHDHDLNFPPPYSAAVAAAEFNLFSHSVGSVASATATAAAAAAAAAFPSSVCTLDKVRCALDRAERSSRAAAAANRIGSASPSPSSTTTASPSPRHRQSSQNTEMRAAACPACLTYVLIATADPRCPRCDSRVPALSAPPPQKKPRIDLNAAAATDDEID